MKKTFFLIPAISIVFFSCDIRKKDKPAQNLPATSAPQEFKEFTSVQIIDTTYNFGKVKEGDIVEYNYRFKNTGDKPLIIADAAASCGCTVPEKPENLIQPGEIGFIKVKFNSDRRPGEVEKTITVKSNAQPEFPQLFLKGTVIGKTEEN